MSIKAILFDLDGTLLPMNQEKFLKAYIGGLSKAAEPHGYEPMTITSSILAGTAAMIKNNGEKTNEAVFWDALAKIYGEAVMEDINIFDEFYQTDFQKIKVVCGFAPQAAAVVSKIKEKGLRVALATNPLFPTVATESRIRWAGLEPRDFELFTSYETSKYSKPNLNYYKEVLSELGLEPEECLMVGNDVADDMVVTKLGMDAFLLTDCLINTKNQDISIYPQGGFDELLSYIENLNIVNQCLDG